MTHTPQEKLAAALSAVRDRAEEPGTLHIHGPKFSEGMRCAANMIERKCSTILSEHGGGGEAVQSMIADVARSLGAISERIRVSHPHLSEEIAMHRTTLLLGYTTPSAPVGVEGTRAPTKAGWHWHFDGDVTRMLYVFPRPGHSYLAVQDEPNEVTGKRQFRMAEKMGGLWYGPLVPPAPAALTPSAAAPRVEHGIADHGIDRAAKEVLVPCDCGCGRSCCACCGTDLGFITERPPIPAASEDGLPRVEGLTPKQAWWAGARAAFGLPADTPRTEVARRLAASGQADKLQAFKDYTHQRLDAMGVPADPDSPHKAAGCRIGGRLDWIEQRLAVSGQGVPDGWKLVPVEPTHEMELALSDALASGDYGIAECLARAIAAAPTQEKA